MCAWEMPLGCLPRITCILSETGLSRGGGDTLTACATVGELVEVLAPYDWPSYFPLSSVEVAYRIHIVDPSSALLLLIRLVVYCLSSLC